MSSQDKIQRSVLPIPDQPHVVLTTYDEKDPDTKYPRTSDCNLTTKEI
jgi:arylsulfatase